MADALTSIAGRGALGGGSAMMDPGNWSGGAGGASYSVPAGGGGGTPLNPVAGTTAASGGPAGGPTPGASMPTGGLFGLLGRVENGGGEDAARTLFGHAQREGGPFAGVDITQMTAREVAEFQNPRGAYAAYVRGRVGRTATPVGIPQVVGTTLRGLLADGTIDPNARFDAATQARVVGALADRRLRAAGDDPAARRRQMRAEWEGFRHVSDADLDAAIAAHLQGRA